MFPPSASRKRNTPEPDIPPPPPAPPPPAPPPQPQEPQEPIHQAPEHDQNHDDNIAQNLPPHEDVFDALSPLEEAMNIPALISPLRDSMITIQEQGDSKNNNPPPPPPQPVPPFFLGSPDDIQLNISSWLSKFMETKPRKEGATDATHYNVSDSSTPFPPPAPCSSPTMIRTVTSRADFEKIIDIQVHLDGDEGYVPADDELMMNVSPDDETANFFRNNDETTIEASGHFPASPSAKLVGAGLVNLGNTCFMNAIMQCLTHTVPLVQGLRSCSHVTPCDDYDADDSESFCAICQLRNHIETCLACPGGIFTPGRLVNNLSNFSSSFRRYQQGDAHEFMVCVLNKLQKGFPEGEENVIDKVFGGRLVSKLQCCNCGHSSNTYEPLIDLSLEVEDATTIQRALDSFTMVEKIDDQKFICDGCLEHVSMEKQLMLYEAPPVLAFHLKRFKKDGTFVKKIDTHVYFTMETDLEPYTLRNPNNNVILKYDLYAVVVHVGSDPNSGHYYCFIRSTPEKWHKIDDYLVTSVFGDQVLCEEAYILFYVQQGIPWFSSSIIKTEKPDEPKPDSDDGAMEDEKKPDSGDGGIDDDPMDAYHENVDMCDSEGEEEIDGASPGQVPPSQNEIDDS